MTPQLIYNHSIEDSDIHNLCEDLVQYSDIAPKYYERFDVKRGLRNADGSGVIAGITRICMVHGYVMSEGERQPIPGQLIYRGYDINDLIENAEREDRCVFEEVATRQAKVELFPPPWSAWSASRVSSSCASALV